MMNFTVYFSRGGIGETGLTPTFTVIRVSDQVAIATDAAMTDEIGLGFYYFAIATSVDEDYVAKADGGVTLSGSERYAPCITEVQGTVDATKNSSAATLGTVNLIEIEVAGLDGEAMRGTDGVSLVVPDAAGVVPTAVENRQEMDANSTKLSAIEIDVTGINGDAMRGTDNANTVVPDAAGVVPTAVENRAEMDLNSTQLAAILSTGSTGPWTTGGGGSAPTAVENRQEMDANSTQFAAIVADVTGINGDAMRGTDNANTIVPDAAGVVPTAVENRQEMDSNSTQLIAIVADTGTDLPADIAAVQATADAIEVDTGTTLPAEHAAIQVTADAIEVDTGTTLPDQITAVSGQITAQQTDITFIRGIEGGSWSIAGSSMIFKNEGGTTIATFTLVGTAPDYSERNLVP